MPAFFLLVRIKRFVLPLPWFPFWLILLPFVPLAILISPFFARENYGRVLQNAHLAWWAVTALHGLKVAVDSSDGDRIFLSFV